MEDFEFQNKGRILFGEGKRDAFLQGVKALSDKVLVVCGPHFARSGELGEMLTAFEEIGIRTWAIADLHQSTIEHARVAWKLCRDNEIGAVVGVGGATAMDFAKLTAYGACQEEDIWPLIAKRSSITTGKRLGLVTVPTFPSSGSDLDSASEMVEKSTDHAGGLYGAPLIPDFCWLNPAYAKSIPPEFLAYGVMTSIIQASNSFLNPKQSGYGEMFTSGLIRNELANLERAIQKPGDEAALGELMVSACMNEFGAGTLGKEGADFSVFFIEGIIEYYWDLPYAPSIVTLFPHWLKSVYSAQPVFRRYFRDAWGVEVDGKTDDQVLELGLQTIEETYREFGLALTLNELKPQKADPAALRKYIAEPGPCESIYRDFTPNDLFDLITRPAG